MPFVTKGQSYVISEEGPDSWHKCRWRVYKANASLSSRVAGQFSASAGDVIDDLTLINDGASVRPAALHATRWRTTFRS
jgi:hypothetical protein